jgi:hypothetical protein
MMKRNNILLIFTLTLLVSVATSCAGYRNLSVNDYKVESLTPRGMRAVDAVVALVIYNPSAAFSVSDVHGVIRHQGEPIATFSAGELTVSRKCEQTYDLSLSGELDQSTSLVKLLRFPGWKPEDLTLDVDAKAKLKFLGLSKKFRIRDYSLADIKEAMTETETKKK